MPYAQPFLQVTCEGVFGTTVALKVEDWRAGFKIVGPATGDFDPANLLTFLTAIAPATSTYHTTVAVAAGSASWLTALSAAYIDTDGTYVLGSLQPTTRYQYPTPAAGSGSSDSPFSQAMCITLRSLNLRGPASHGRIYWPAVGLKTGTGTGLLSTTGQNNISTAAQTWLNAVNTQAALRFGSSHGVGLASKVGLGRQALANQVGIGARLDSQESRERNLPEAHVFKALTVSLALTKARDDELREKMRDLQNDTDGS